MKTLDEIRPAITSLEAIPAIPAIVQPLASMLQLPVEQVDVEQVVQLVSYDSSIAAHCLRMANSPLFGRRKTETVRSAVLTLGLKRVQAILLGCCLNKIVPADKWAFNATTFWRHSLGCALVSRKLAALIGYPERRRPTSPACCMIWACWSILLPAPRNIASASSQPARKIFPWNRRK